MRSRLVPVANAAGGKGGTGPGGVPDGGTPCATVAQYAAATTGFQGNGPAFQTFALGDYQLAYERARGNAIARVALFADRYADFTSRRFRLPFVAQPGDVYSTTDQDEHEGGAVFSYDVSAKSNSAGLGTTNINTAFALAKNTSKASSLLAAPVAHQQTVELRDVSRAAGSPLAVFANVALSQRIGDEQLDDRPARDAAVQRDGPRRAARLVGRDDDPALG